MARTSPSSTGSYVASLPAHPATSGVVREVLRGLPLLTRLTSEQRQTLALLTTEIVSNAIAHGSREGDDIELRLELEAAHLRVSVFDAARGAAPVVLTFDETREGGR